MGCALIVVGVAVFAVGLSHEAPYAIPGTGPFAWARAAAAIGLYPREARKVAVSLRLDPCPE